MWVRFTGKDIDGTKVIGVPGPDANVMAFCRNLEARGLTVVSLTATPPADVVPALVAAGRMAG